MTTTIENPQSFLRAFATLQRKAVRLGLTRPTAIPLNAPYTKLKTVTHGGSDEKVTYETTVQDFEIEANSFHVDGWSLVAKLEKVGDETVVIKITDSDTDLRRHHHMGFHCEHCNTRRTRTSALVLEKDGETIQVGKSCLKDFFPNAPDNLISVFSFQESVYAAIKDNCYDDEAGPRGGRVVHSIPVVNALAIGLAFIGKYGYVSRSKAADSGRIATADEVQGYLADPKGKLPESGDRDLTAEAEALIEWYVGEADEENEFDRTTLIYIRHGYVPVRRVGFILSIKAKADRDATEKLRKEASAKSEFIGEVGKRIKFTGKVKSVKNFEGFYGPGCITTVVTGEGNLVKYWNSLNAKSSCAEEGDEVEFMAAVKAHEEDSFLKGKVTTVTRATKVQILTPHAQ